jgi:hypothetical protein
MIDIRWLTGGQSRVAYWTVIPGGLDENEVKWLTEDDISGLPEDEVELWEGEHDDAQKGGDCAVHHGGEHCLQG